MNENNDMQQNIQKLLQLMKQILLQEGNNPQFKQGLPSGFPADLKDFLKDQKNVQLNMCVFAFLPIEAQDYEDMEGVCEEVMSCDLDEGHSSSSANLSMEMTTQDFDFLKKNGIKF